MSDQPAPSRLRRLATAPIFKAGLILVLILLLQLPLGAVSGLIEERQARQEEVVAGFRQNWGPGQVIRAPVLAVPYAQVARSTTAGEPATVTRGWIEIRARRLAIAAQLAPESRRRGLFPAIVYAATVAIEGAFELPVLEQPGMPPIQAEWGKAVLVTQATDLRAQKAEDTAQVDGQNVRQTVEVTRGECGGVLLAAAGIAGNPQPGTAIAFRTGLTLHGTQSLGILPDAREARVHASAPWPAPGFTGSLLPTTYAVDADGFRADWAANGDNATAGWRFGTGRGVCLRRAAGEGDVFGVDLLEPVPTYLMVSRAAKYGTLFLALAFLTYFLFETVARARIHLAQYVLLGLSVSLFALLLVALAEPLGFTAGYAIGTAAVMAQASLYTLSVVGSARLAAMFAGVLGALFAYLYLVLRLDSLSLLAGAVAVFAGLSAVMAVTRRLDWSGRGAVAEGTP